MPWPLPTSKGVELLERLEEEQVTTHLYQVAIACVVTVGSVVVKVELVAAVIVVHGPVDEKADCH